MKKNGFFKPKCYIPEAYIVKNGHDLGGTPAVGDGTYSSISDFLSENGGLDGHGGAPK